MLPKVNTCTRKHKSWGNSSFFFFRIASFRTTVNEYQAPKGQVTRLQAKGFSFNMKLNQTEWVKPRVIMIYFLSMYGNLGFNFCAFWQMNFNFSANGIMSINYHAHGKLCERGNN